MTRITSLLEQISVTLFVATLSLVMLMSPGRSEAQTTHITPTHGVGDLGTVVPSPVAGTTSIVGGTPMGSNLFHSFAYFSIGAGEMARFETNSGAANPSITNILSRVTGGSPSDIFGTINSQTFFPHANLFLLNPAGFVFGPNATINVGGSANFATANYLRLGDGFMFNTVPGSADALLSIAAVNSFGFSGGNPMGTIHIEGGTIRNAGALTLVGRDKVDGTTVTPGIEVTGTLSNIGGNVTLVSVGSPTKAGTGEFTVADQIPTGFDSLGTIALGPGASIDTSTNSSFNNPMAAGPIVIQGGQLEMNGASLKAISRGYNITAFPGTGDTIPELLDPKVNVMAGDIHITVNTLNMQSGSTIQTGSALVPQGNRNNPGGLGDGSIINENIGLTPGNIRFNVQHFLAQDSTISTASSIYQGSAGFVSIRGIGGSPVEASSVRLVNTTLPLDAGPAATSGGLAGGGDILAKDVILEGVTLTATTPERSGGDFTISSSHNITINHSQFTSQSNLTESGSFIFEAGNKIDLFSSTILASSPIGFGSGKISLTAPVINVTGGSLATDASKAAGDISLNVDQLMLTDASISSSQKIFDNCGGCLGHAGQITVQGQSGADASTTSVSLDHSTISTTVELGDSSSVQGDIKITAQAVTLSNGSLISSDTSGAAPAGDITLNVDKLTATNNSIISSDSNFVDSPFFPDLTGGRAGSITIQGITGPGSPATSVSLDNSTISTTIAGGTSSNIPATIDITAQTINLMNSTGLGGGHIQADTSGAAPAGGITLNVGTLTADGLSLISSSSGGMGTGSGNAGNVIVRGPGGSGTLADSVTISQSEISTEANAGAAGSISLASNNISLSSALINSRINGSDISLDPGPQANITFTAQNMLINTSTIQADVGKFSPTAKAAGSITFNVETFTAQSGQDVATISSIAGPFASNAGTVTFNGLRGPGTAAESIHLDHSIISTTIGGGNALSTPATIAITAQAVDLTNGAQIKADTSGAAPAGNIDVTAGDVNISGASNILTTTSGNGDAGNITVQASNINITGVANSPDPFFTDFTGMGVSTFGTGNGGDIRITADNLNLRDKGTIAAGSLTSFSGNAGDIVLTLNDTLSLKGGSTLFGSTFSNKVDVTGNPAGKGGDISVVAKTVTLGELGPFNSDPHTPDAGVSAITSQTTGSNPAGAISIKANNVNLSDSATITTSTLGHGISGNITITADTVNISGTNEGLVQKLIGLGDDPQDAQIASRSHIGANSSGGLSGDAGSVLITSRNLTLDDGGLITTGSVGIGNAGPITLNVDNLSMTAGGEISSSSTSALLTSPTFVGNAGRIAIQGFNGPDTATTAVMLDNSSMNTRILGGRASDIIIATPVLNGGKPTLFPGNTPASISINAGTISLANGSEVSSSTAGAAPGGNVTFRVNDTVSIHGTNLKGFSSTIDTATVGRGDAGNISIMTRALNIDGGQITAGSGFLGLTQTGKGGSIDIHAETVTSTGGAEVRANTSSTLATGQAGSITISATDSIVVNGADTSIESATNIGPANAGEVMLIAPTIAIGQGAIVRATSDPLATGNAGSVTLQAARLNINDGATLDSSTLGSGHGGSVTITATEQMTVAGSSTQIRTITNGSGQAGQVSIKTPSLQVDGGVIKANTGADGPAGSVTIAAGSLTLGNGAQIISRATQDPTTGKASAGDAGNVTLNVTGLFSSQGSTVSSSANQGKGGIVIVNAGNLQLTGNTTVSAESAGSKDAGSITLTSATDLLMRNSTVATSAAQASGGNITLTAPHLIRLVDSTLSSSVAADSKGGDITIDPQLVVLQHSQILANATGNKGAGGNINIFASGAVLVDPNSRIDASAGPAGINGSVNINAPIQVLSGALVPLNLVYSQAGLSGDRCAADPNGQFSSFVQVGRDGGPQTPGNLTSSPLGFLDGLQTSSLGMPGQSISQIVRLGLFESLTDETGRILFYSGCRS